MDKLFGLKVVITGYCALCWKKLTPKKHTHKCIGRPFSKKAIALVGDKK